MSCEKISGHKENKIGSIHLKVDSKFSFYKDRFGDCKKWRIRCGNVGLI